MGKILLWKVILTQIQAKRPWRTGCGLFYAMSAFWLAGWNRPDFYPLSNFIYEDVKGRGWGTLMFAQALAF